MTANRAIAALVLAAALTGAAAGPVSACAYDNEPQDLSIDTLDHYYPGAYGVVLAVVAARRDGTLTRLLDPDAQKLFSFQRLLHVVRSFEGQMRAAAREASVAPPATAVLLVESMLWVRLPADVAERGAQVHVPHASPGDLVVVLGDDALAAIAGGKLDIATAEHKGFLNLQGAASAQADFRRVYANVGRSRAPAMR